MRVYGLEGGPLRRSGRKLADLPSASQAYGHKILFNILWAGLEGGFF